MNDCPLCEVIGHGSTLKFHGDEHAAAVLHDDWAVRGHSMIVAARHVENVSDLDHAEFEAFMDMVRRVETALLRVFNADRAIWIKLGLAVPHLHLHVYPVTREMDRAAIFDAFDGKRRDEPDEREKERIVAALSAELQRAR